MLEAVKSNSMTLKFCTNAIVHIQNSFNKARNVITKLLHQ